MASGHVTNVISGFFRANSGTEKMSSSGVVDVLFVLNVKSISDMRKHNKKNGGSTIMLTSIYVSACTMWGVFSVCLSKKFHEREAGIHHLALTFLFNAVLGPILVVAWLLLGLKRGKLNAGTEGVDQLPIGYFYE